MPWRTRSQSSGQCGAPLSSKATSSPSTLDRVGERELETWFVMCQPRRLRTRSRSRRSLGTRPTRARRPTDRRRAERRGAAASDEEAWPARDDGRPPAAPECKTEGCGAVTDVPFPRNCRRRTVTAPARRKPAPPSCPAGRAAHQWRSLPPGNAGSSIRRRPHAPHQSLVQAVALPMTRSRPAPALRAGPPPSRPYAMRHTSTTETRS